MSNEKIKKHIHLIYGIFLGVITVIAAVCIMVSCVNLYQTDSYSREAVATSFSKIAIPVYLCLVTVIGGFLLNAAWPLEKKKRAVTIPPSMQLERLHAKIDLTSCDAQLSAAIYQEQNKRKLHQIISCILLGVSAVIFLLYALNGNHYHQSDINGSMIKAVVLMAICLILPFIYAVFTSYYSKRSIERELALVKQIKTTGTSKAVSPVAKTKQIVLIVRCVIVVVGIAFLIYGLLTGGVADVLTKAINICTECIGLG